nr:hypothetical protein GCM10020093_067550 [Planobispora longispora]
MPTNDPTATSLVGSAGPEPYLPPATQPVRSVVWVIHLALPMLGLWLLLANHDHINVKWQHNPSHFLLIIVVAGINFVLGTMISQTAARRSDARLLLLSLVFLSSSGFFLMHGLATPKVILPAGSYGFDLSQPVGLLLASGFAFASALPLNDRAAAAVLRSQIWLRGGLALLLVLWGCSRSSPVSPRCPASPGAGGGLGGAELLGLALYGAAAVLLFQHHRRRPAAMLISMITAYALLAEAMLAGMYHRNWHLSWWLWHLLLTFAFVFVAYGAHIQSRREGTTAGLFDSIALTATVRRIRADYERALEELVGHLRRRADSRVPVATRLAGKFGLTEAQAAVLDRAGEALANERELSERLAALVDLGNRARVGLPEDELLVQSLERARQAYGDVRIALVSDGRVSLGAAEYRADDFPAGGPIRADGSVVHPLTVKGRLAGALRVPVGRTPQDDALAATLAARCPSPWRTPGSTRSWRPCSGSTCRRMWPSRCWPIRGPRSSAASWSSSPRSSPI